MKKISSNVERDKKVNLQLQNEGWRVIRIWEHEIRKEPDRVVQRIYNLLKDQDLT